MTAVYQCTLCFRVGAALALGAMFAIWLVEYVKAKLQNRRFFILPVTKLKD